VCNLYASTTAQSAMRSLFDVPAHRDRLGNAEPLPAIFPRYKAPVVRLGESGERELTAMHWGFIMPQISKKTGAPIQPKAINNTRDDTVRVSRFWRLSFETRRCLIPASSFCEAKGRAPADYHWFGVDGRSPFALAGIWTHYRGRYKDELREIDTYSMLTTTPNAVVAPVHPDRMPVILHPADYNTWLTGPPDAAFALLRPFPADRMEVLAHDVGLKSEPPDLQSAVDT